MELTSTAFKHGTTIPKRYTCDGDDPSPPLAWKGAPAGTKSFALIMDDPDAPPGTWVHWVIYDLPGPSTGLPEGVPKTPALADGSKQGTCWGVDSFSRTGCFGPCPPPGKPHRYFFKLYALSAPLGLPPGATKAEVMKTMTGRVLAETTLMGTYGR